MSKLDGYDQQDQERIKSLMCRLVEGQIARGEIECTDEAIKAAMPQALADARATVNAVNEYLCG
jgi:hypothetical protein